MKMPLETKVEIEALLKTVGKLTLKLCSHPVDDVKEKARLINQLTHKAYDKMRKL